MNKDFIHDMNKTIEINQGSMIKDRSSTIPFIFGDVFPVRLYTLSSHFCNSFFVRTQFYQTLLKIPEAFNLNCYINTITVTIKSNISMKNA